MALAVNIKRNSIPVLARRDGSILYPIYLYARCDRDVSGCKQSVLKILMVITTSCISFSLWKFIFSYNFPTQRGNIGCTFLLADLFTKITRKVLKIISCIGLFHKINELGKRKLSHCWVCVDRNVLSSRNISEEKFAMIFLIIIKMFTLSHRPHLQVFLKCQTLPLRLKRIFNKRCSAENYCFLPFYLVELPIAK